MRQAVCTVFATLCLRRLDHGAVAVAAAFRRLVEQLTMLAGVVDAVGYDTPTKVQLVCGFDYYRIFPVLSLTSVNARVRYMANFANKVLAKGEPKNGLELEKCI